MMKAVKAVVLCPSPTWAWTGTIVVWWPTLAAISSAQELDERVDCNEDKFDQELQKPATASNGHHAVGHLEKERRRRRQWLSRTICIQSKADGTAVYRTSELPPAQHDRQSETKVGAHYRNASYSIIGKNIGTNTIKHNLQLPILLPSTIALFLQEIYIQSAVWRRKLTYDKKTIKEWNFPTYLSIDSVLGDISCIWGLIIILEVSLPPESTAGKKKGYVTKYPLTSNITSYQ